MTSRPVSFAGNRLPKIGSRKKALGTAWVISFLGPDECLEDILGSTFFRFLDRFSPFSDCRRLPKDAPPMQGRGSPRWKFGLAGFAEVLPLFLGLAFGKLEAYRPELFNPKGATDHRFLHQFFPKLVVPCPHEQQSGLPPKMLFPLSG